MAADLSHINTPAKVTAHLGPAQLAEALEGADIVIVPAGVPRKPGMKNAIKLNFTNVFSFQIFVWILTFLRYDS